MALAWVRDNIRQFGGDPGLVTINGQSAGSFASTYHLVSPLARSELGPGQGLTSRSVQGTVPARHSAERRGRLLALLPPLLRRARAQVRPARRARARLPQADLGRHRRVSPGAVRH